ncbi:MAG: preprotein translocase subunit SecE [Burkholderiaceae bacterium]|nr:preprotein translocase subunit SecE [Burkholderiaceae bacterium]
MSTTSPEIETVSPAADKAKLAAAALLLVGGVVAYYLIKQADWIRWSALIVLLLAAVATFFLSEPGKQLLAFGRDAWRETQKVVWPSRKEAIQMTGYVFAFVVVMAFFLWLTDKTLEWVLYDLVLGWKR